MFQDTMHTIDSPEQLSCCLLEFQDHVVADGHSNLVWLFELLESHRVAINQLATMVNSRFWSPCNTCSHERYSYYHHLHSLIHHLVLYLTGHLVYHKQHLPLRRLKWKLEFSFICFSLTKRSSQSVVNAWKVGERENLRKKWVCKLLFSDKNMQPFE